MPIIESRIDPQSENFRANREQMLALIGEFRALEQKVRDASNARRDRFRARKQLLPRERVALLLDPGAPWLELSTLAGFRMHDDDGDAGIQGGGGIAGIGYVSGGANLLYQAEMFVEGGRGFANQARLSAAGVPQITVVHGSSTAGGAYLPGLSDYVILVRGRAKVFLAGPPLLRAATGEIATDEELGGADMHATISGLGEYLAEDDADGIRIAREIMAKLPWNEQLLASPQKSFKEPRYAAEELAGVVPADYRKPYDVREVIARIVDDSDYLDFKTLYGPHTVCGQAEIEGHAIGLIGNNGPIDADGAGKAAQFIQLCCQANMPIVYLQNTTGYMVGREAEQAGIIKHGSKMIQAVANATVPQLTIHIGASFGAGNYGMCGRAYDPRFIFAWPSNRIAVMGGEQAAKVMAIVTEEKLKREGKPVDKAKLGGMEQAIINRVDAESTALFATARLWDDGLIDPRDTRKVLGFCLAICREAALRPLKPITFGVGRM
jgi:geranyl-CoA carboxylase beta subunit